LFFIDLRPMISPFLSIDLYYLFAPLVTFLNAFSCHFMKIFITMRAENEHTSFKLL
jgi:hypothetical protein